MKLVKDLRAQSDIAINQHLPVVYVCLKFVLCSIEKLWYKMSMLIH